MSKREETHRFNAVELSAEISDDRLLRAADQIRQFMKSDAGFVFQKWLEDERRRFELKVYIPAAMMTLTEYAEASGAVNMVDKVYDITDKIVREAKKLEHE